MNIKKKQRIKKNTSQTKENPYASKWYIIVILIITTIVFSNAITNDFVNWDDDAYIHENPYIKELNIESVIRIFKEPYFGNYHPLTTLTYAIEYHYFELNPTVYHFTNILIHLINVLFVFLFIKLLHKNINIAAITALLFAIHPLHVESVSWISERKDVLFAMFFLLSLINYVKYFKDKTKWNFLLLSLICFICSLLSKPTAIVLPGVLFLLQWYFSKKMLLKDLLYIIPFFILSFVFGLIALAGQEEVLFLEHIKSSFTLFERFLMICYAVYFYVSRFLVPFNLSALHPYPNAITGLSFEYYLAPFVIICLIVIYFFIKKELKRVYVFGMGFFIVGILLFIQFLPFGNAIVSERYTYVPYIGLSFIFAYVTETYLHVSTKKIFLIGYILFISITTYTYNKVWQNSETLWSNVISKYPQSALAYNSRATYYFEKDNIKKALSDIDKSILLKPDYDMAYYNKGNILKQLDKLEEAILYYDKAILLNNKYIEALINRGLVNSLMGNYNDAIDDYLRALEINPNHFECMENLGGVYFDIKDYINALKYFEKVMELYPNYGKGYTNRGTTKYMLNDTEGACRDWEHAVNLGYNDALVNINTYCK